MKKGIGIAICIVSTYILSAQDMDRICYHIDLTRNPDSFFVSIQLPTKTILTDSIFEFAVSAPGTYQTMNIGRFVSGIKIINESGKAISYRKISTNKYKIDKPEQVHSMEYYISETFGTPADSLPIYLMAGSVIENDFALINPAAILGFFPACRTLPVTLIVHRPTNWKFANKSGREIVYADSYEKLADDPILTGNLRFADTIVGTTKVKLFAYSDDISFSADTLLKYLTVMLTATRHFLRELPVRDYTFQFVIMKNPPGRGGALEHRNGSTFVLPVPFEMNNTFYQATTTIAAHEFFHIITPFTIHSDENSPFDFGAPVGSRLVWFYEGVTEWASHILQYRGGIKSLNDYILYALQHKILMYEERYDKTWSLERIGESTFTIEGFREFDNLYFKGALTALYLDIRLLELSDGKRGLRELLLELSEVGASGKTFQSDAFLRQVVEMTNPSINDFIDRYIRGSEPLPHEEYLKKIGLQYVLKETQLGKIHTVEKIKNLSKKQSKLFAAWSRNLPWK